LTTDAVCPAGARPVSENPSGQINGQNAIFQLSTDPYPGLPVRVFSNGIQLKSPRDYQVSGTSLTFSRTHIPSLGDVINAFYFVQADANAQSAAKSLQPQSTKLPATGERDISNQLLRNALNQEMAEIPQGTAPATAVAPQNNVRNARPAPDTHYLSSIGMLQRRLNVARILSKQHGSRDVSADGIEGLGDVSVPSPFDVLTFSGNSELDQLLQPQATAASRSPLLLAAPLIPTAIEMLVDRLREK
jgi:hypothetical protein